jgi:hypothetical protein
MFYTFSGAEEIGNGNSASSSHGFTDASRSRPFLWQNDTYRRFLPHLRCAAVLTQLITRAVINVSTSNNQRLIRQLRCRDLDPRTKAEFCGLVVQSLVESGTLKVSKRMTGRRGSPNWAGGHFDMDSHLIALQPGYFKRLYRLSKETFLKLVTLIYPRLVRKKSRGPGKASSMDPRVMLAITLRFLAGATCLNLAWPYCIALPTVYSVIDETLEVLDDSLQNIKFPYTEDECRAASEGFQRLRNSPFYGVIGVIDGIAIAIRAAVPFRVPEPPIISQQEGLLRDQCSGCCGSRLFCAVLIGKTRRLNARQYCFPFHRAAQLAVARCRRDCRPSSVCCADCR